jgi:hypothetical protein
MAADARAANAPATYLVSPNSHESFGCIERLISGCLKTAQSFDELRQFLIYSVPEGERRNAALKRMAERLGAKPFPDEAAIAADWTEKAETSAPLSAVLGAWEKIGCDASGAPFVVRALLGRLDRDLFANEAPAKAKLARAFLTPSCAGAKGLKDSEIARLQKIAGSAPPPKP